MYKEERFRAIYHIINILLVIMIRTKRGGVARTGMGALQAPKNRWSRATDSLSVVHAGRMRRIRELETCRRGRSTQ